MVGRRLESVGEFGGNEALYPSISQDAYRSYLQAYASYSTNASFDINKLYLVRVARPFGFSVPPKVRLFDFFRC